MAATLRVLLGTNVLLLIFGLVGGTFCLAYTIGLMGDYAVTDQPEMWGPAIDDLRYNTNWLGFLLTGLAYALSLLAIVGIVGTIKRKKGILLFYIIMMTWMVVVDSILACFILCATSIPFCDQVVQRCTTSIVVSVDPPASEMPDGPDLSLACATPDLDRVGKDYWDKETNPNKKEHTRNVVEKTFDCYGRSECQAKIPDKLSDPYNIMAIILMGMTILMILLVCMSVLTFRRVKRGEKIV